MNNIENKGTAIWRPIFPSYFPMTALLSGIVLIIFLSLFPSPIHDEGESKILYELSTRIPDVRAVTENSELPLPIALSYGSAILLPPIFGVLTALSIINLLPLREVISKKNATSRVIITLFLLVALICPYLIELTGNIHQPSSKILLIIKSSRAAIALWSICTLNFFYFSWLFVLFEISNFAKYITGLKSGDK